MDTLRWIYWISYVLMYACDDECVNAASWIVNTAKRAATLAWALTQATALRLILGEDDFDNLMTEWSQS